jgi:predicted P-loop ATPase
MFLFNDYIPAEICGKLNTKSFGDYIVQYYDELFNEEAKKTYRYNLLSRMPEVLSDGKYIQLKESDYTVFSMRLNETLAQMSCPHKITNDLAVRLVGILTEWNSVDPFYDYVSQIKWDGIPRVRRWFIDGLGVSIPGVSKDKSDLIIEEATQAWFVGTIGRSNGNACKLEIVPVLIGDQGTYKSTYVAYTAMSTVVSDWYNASVADLRDPKYFFESVRGAKIVEWSESTQLKRAEDVELLKAFISQEKDTYRPSYARNSETYNRQFSCIMTSNEKRLFNDDTGNRRFVPMVCSDNRSRQINHSNMVDNLYDVQQVWAEALALLRDGAKTYLPADVEKLAMCQTKQFAKSNEFFEEILFRLDDLYPGVGSSIQVMDLKKLISNIKYDFDEMRNRTVKTEDLVKYSDGEWILEPKKNIWVDNRRIRRDVLTRIKPPSRIAEE